MSTIVPSGASTSTCPPASKRVRTFWASCSRVSGERSASSKMSEVGPGIRIEEGAEPGVILYG
jgi:hypothetical protein